MYATAPQLSSSTAACSCLLYLPIVYGVDVERRGEKKEVVPTKIQVHEECKKVGGEVVGEEGPYKQVKSNTPLSPLTSMVSLTHY